jgi:cytoskeletal protein RodZ
MVLAVVVFLYAGVLVWQLLQHPAAQNPGERSPTVEVEPSLPVPPAEPADAQALDAESAETPPQEAKKAPERKSSTVSPRPRRRRPRPKSQRASTPAPEPVKPAKKAVPSRQKPAPEVDPVDIDIQNPYRN